MKLAKYLLLSLLAMLLAMFSVSCDNGDEDEWNEDNITSADAVQGGLLYDKWWAVTSSTAPSTDHPMWASQTGSNARTGSDTWRCKECHGWDYQGAAGAYGSGSHYTGFAGVWPARADASEDVFNQIGDGTNHDFSSVLTDDELYALTKFVTTEQIDVGLYIDLTTKVADGDAANGEALYENATATGGQCITCHGDDGENYDFGGLSALANGNPWETLHKIRFGHPGSTMPSTVTKGLSDQDAVDILAYAQTVLATVGTWLADATTGDLGNTTAVSGSLAGAGWTKYQLTLNADGTFTATGDNPYGIPLYGSTATVEGTITYSGTYTIDATASPMEIDLTATASDLEAFFTTAAESQPVQPGILELNAINDELTIQYGATAFSVPRPTAFMLDDNSNYDCGTLVKQ